VLEKYMAIEHRVLAEAMHRITAYVGLTQQHTVQEILDAVAAVVAIERLPMSVLMRRYCARPIAQAALLGGGDDYELCFTAAPAKRAAVERAASRARTPVTRIGRVIRAPEGACSAVIVDGDGLPVEVRQKGFDHFG
jgi:thiamine-monophosphate kinase